MSRLKNFLDNFEGYCCVVALAVMSIVVFINVIFRWIGASLRWSEELSRYLLVWVTFMGGAYGVKTYAHIGVEAFTILLPVKARKVLSIIVAICGIVLCSVILYFGIRLVNMNFQTNQLTPAMRIPIAYMYMAIPIGMACFIIRYVLNIHAAIKELLQGDIMETSSP